MSDTTSVNDTVNTEEVLSAQTQDLSPEDNMSDEDFAKEFDKEVSGIETTIEEPQAEQAVVLNDNVANPEITQEKDNAVTPQETKDKPLVNDENQTKFIAPTKEQIEAIIGGSIKSKGKDISIESHDELVKYLQLGASYYDDRQEIKPLIQIAKTFEKQGIKSQEQINFLIDLANGDKNAIAKLIKDKNIELSDIDDSIEEGTYKANDYSIDQAELNIERHLKVIENDESYDKTIEVLSNTDKSSKQFISDNPEFIEVINSHIGNGVYETIQDEITKMKSLGQLQSGSEIDNYIAVGKSLFEKNNVNAQEPQNVAPKVNTVFSRNNEVHTDNVIKDDSNNVNINALSDEEFMKKFGHL